MCGVKLVAYKMVKSGDYRERRNFSRIRNSYELKDLLEMYAPFPGEKGCQILFHVETKSLNEHAILLKDIEVEYNRELLLQLQREFLVSNIWVSAKP